MMTQKSIRRPEPFRAGWRGSALLAFAASGITAVMFAKPEEGFDTFAPENASPLIGYLASPRAERISGYVFIIWNKEVKIVSRPGIDGIFNSDERWTTESLHDALAPFFEKREPVTDGYTVPAM